ncbi:zinc finger matrin-type protein 3 [Conger conger]|uniref:zinc finger matrin-type protein 3 n=1 Tax=Conger conger TaxID=82655 RepID=UPI002A5B09C0|nr:zinc finger matrin-type protein 3 [Conger conger]
MAMNVKNRGPYFQSNDYCRNYNSQAINYGNHYFPRLPGPESLLKPPLELMCQAPPPFQPAPPPQALGPPPDPTHFSLPAPLPAEPLPLPLPQLGPPSPKPLEQEGGAMEQDAALEDLCKPLYCKLCNVTLNSAQQAQAHYQGKNHSKKLRNFYAGSQQPPPVRIPEALEPVAQQPLATPPADSAPPCKPVQVFTGARVILATESDYCKLCDASFSSPTVAQAHYQGKNHAKRLRLSEAQQDSSESNQRRPRKEGAEFKLLKMRRNTHLPSNLPGPYFNPRPRQRIPRDLAMCVTPSGQFYCSLCNTAACEEPDFRLHLESKPHKSRVSEQRYRSEMETLGYT